MLYLYLCGGFPTMVREDERSAHEGHQLVAVFGDPMVAWLAYAAMRAEALEQLRQPAVPPPPGGEEPATSGHRPGSSPACPGRRRR